MNAAPRPFDDIRALILKMPGPDEAAVAAAREREGQLTKPAGSLGRLEEISAFLAGWQASARPHVDKPLVAVFAGNHGVVAKGVSPYPQSVTQAMVANFTAGGAAINQICKTFDISLKVYELALEKPTGDITEGPAMDERTCAGTIAFGMEALASQPDLLALGEMGIGNTTAAAAICHALYGGEPEDWVGRGAGVDDAGLKRKAEAVRAAVARHKAHFSDPLEVLARLGGREIAAMAGAILAARLRRTPVVLDGFVVCVRRGGPAGARHDRARPLPRRPRLGRAGAPRSAEAARQGAAARSRHAARRRFGRGAGGRNRQGRRRLPQRHGDLRRGGGGRQGRISFTERSSMDERRWSAVDAYFTRTIVRQDGALEAALAANAAAGLPQIDVSPPHGKLLHLLARMAHAQQSARDRGARRLFHDLDRPRAAAGRPARDARGLREACGGGATQHRGGGLERQGRGAGRRGARPSAEDRGRGARAFRFRLHRRRQVEQRELSDLGFAPVAAGDRDRRRQRGPGGRDRGRQRRRIRARQACAACSN